MSESARLPAEFGTRRLARGQRLPRRLNAAQVFGRLGLLCLLGLSAAGCSGRLPTYPVDGRVEFEGGSPVHVGTVELRSREHGIQARGVVEPDGSFRLTTYSPGDGAVQGTHDCVVVQMVVAEGLTGHRPSAIGVIDRRYSSYDTSGLVVQVQPQASNRLTLQVQGLRPQQPSDHTPEAHER